ncbi:MAG: hypothetical protein HZA52_19970, partial [Planctomycetes bacterium]|nr:hypothetical protein [Planctomycetota bacterium]
MSVKSVARAWRGRVQRAVLLAVALAPTVRAQEPGELWTGGTLSVSLIDNGWFGELPEKDTDDERAQRFPWWTTVSGSPTSADWAESGDAAFGAWGFVVTRKGDALRQPIALYSGTLRVPNDAHDPTEGFEVRGSVQGPGVITLIDGTGARASIRLEAASGDIRDFRIPLHEFDAAPPLPLVPRFVLELSNDGSDTSAKWGPVVVLVDLPCPPSGWLKQQLHAELDWIFRLWLERGLDREGPRETSFTCNMLDVVTGVKLLTVEAVSQPQPLYELMLDAWVIEHDAAWGAALERYVEEFLTLGIQPDTGIPRQYDCVRDEPLDRNALEI